MLSNSNGLDWRGGFIFANIADSEFACMNIRSLHLLRIIFDGFMLDANESNITRLWRAFFRSRVNKLMVCVSIVINIA